MFSPEIIWFGIALALFCGEVLVSGFILIFFGFGAIGVSIVSFFVKISLNWQLFIFILLSLFSLLVLRKRFSSVFIGDKTDGEDADMDDLIGQRAVVSEDIVPGSGGKVIFKGVSWSADSSAYIAADNQVVITGKVSIRLIVEPIKVEGE